jgi:sialic acid synthase SpsE
MHKRLELDADAHQVLIEHCPRRRIKFLSTAFDLESVILLQRLGVDLFKVAIWRNHQSTLLAGFWSLG